MTAAREVMPGVEGAGLTRRFNGLFSFTTDGFPVLGESPQVRGFWSAQAVWITHAGGVGRAVAEWIVNGEPTTDLRECDIRRFHPHALSRPYVRARSAQQYREVYDIIHPRQQMDSPRNIRLTPFFVRQQELGGCLLRERGMGAALNGTRPTMASSTRSTSRESRGPAGRRASGRPRSRPNTSPPGSVWPCSISRRSPSSR